MTCIPSASSKRRLPGGATLARTSPSGVGLLGCVAFAALCGACSGTVTGEPLPSDTGVPGPMDGAQPPGGPGPVGEDPMTPPPVVDPGEVPPLGPVNTGDVQLRRLNIAEYSATIADWLGITPDVGAFPPDALAAGFDTVGSSLAVSQLHVENYERSATAVIDTLFSTDPGGVRATWCSYASGDAVADEACAAQIVASFAERAWRRPHASWAGNDGLATYQADLTAAGRFAGQPLEERLKLVLQAILVGPRFLLRVELADAAGQLDAPSLASRLSYMLWNSAPDAQALQSNLLDDTVLRAELARMQYAGAGAAATHDAKFERFLQRFPDMWLELGSLQQMSRNPDLFPTFNSELALAMRAETTAFFRRFVGLGDHPDYTPALPLRQLLTADLGPAASPDVAVIYGDSPRSGLLTQASILAVTATPSRTSAVRRGKWIMEHLLCAPPPPPTPAIQAEIKAKPELDANLPERERLAIHRADAKCAGCHQTMDVIGLGLENYDAIGTYRTMDDHGNVIDPSGTLPGTDKPFASAAELISVLAEDPRVTRCMAQQLLTYGTGREYTADDAGLIDSVMAAAGGTEANFQSTLEAVVMSPAFRKREGSI